MAACDVTLSPASADANAGFSTGQIALQTGAGCPWLVSNAVKWINVTTEPRGAGPGSFSFAVSQNPNSGPRFGALLVGGRQVRVRQAGTGTTKPAVAENGVINGASFLFGSPIATGTWVTIQGSNLAATARIWRDSDFSGTHLPTQLDGVSVLINGKPAYVYYISPTQLNVLAPDDTATGQVNVEVTAPQGKAEGVMVNRADASPALFLFDADERKYVAAVHADGKYVGKPSLYPALSMRVAKPGDTILLFGTGFGATNPPAPPGEFVASPAPLSQTPVIYIGDRVAAVSYAGLISPGLYQFNVLVPALPPGDYPVTVNATPFSSPPLLSQTNAYLTVE